MDAEKLLSLLKGIPEAEATAILATLEAKATAIASRVAAQKHLDEAKEVIVLALEDVIKSVKDFDVKVRAGIVEVKVLGTVPGTSRVSVPVATPIRDTGMKQRDLVAKYTPDKLGDYDATKSSNTRYQLALDARKVKIAAEVPAEAPAP